MRCRALLSVAMLAFWATQATTQEARVVLRAGEHTDFTRLVLSLPRAATWRLEPKSDHVDVIIDDPALSIDVSRVFEKIPRSRVRDVTALATGLRVHLACPCVLRPVDGFDSQIVFDIVSPSLDGNPALRPRPRPDRGEAASATVQAPAPSIAARAGLALARTLRKPDTTHSAALVPNYMAETPSVPPDTTPPPTPSADAAQTLLLGLTNVISGAVSRGVLSPDARFEAVTSSAHGLDDSAAAHLRHANQAASPTDSALDPCENATSRLVTDWSLRQDTSIDGPLWAALYDPMDRLDQSAALQLGASLLQAGLGAEARAVLSLLPSSDTVATLADLSFVMDHQQPTQPDRLLAASGCSDTDTLWAFLAAPDTTLKRSGAEENILRAVQLLSPPMRAHLGPRIVQALIQQGATDAARLVQTTVRRIAPERGADLDLLVAAPTEVADVAADTLTGLDVPELIMMLENSNLQKIALSTETLRQAVSRQFELRRSAEGRVLGKEVARALALAGRHEQAFALATSPDTDLAPQDLQPLLDDLFQMLAASASDTAFVTTVFAQKPWAGNGPDPIVRAELAARLADLGFEAEAQALAERPTALRLGEAAPSSADDPLPELARAGQERDQMPLQNLEGGLLPEQTDMRSGALRSAPAAEPLPAQTQGQVPAVVESTPPAAPNSAATESAAANMGLLAQSRSQLRQSAILRDELTALLGEREDAQ